MGRFRMNGPQHRPRRSKRRFRDRIIAVTLMVIGVPMMTLLPLAFLGLPIDGIGYLTGHGEKITVTIVKSSKDDAIGHDKPGVGHYTRAGERKTVRIDDVEEGDTVSARVAVTSDPDDDDPRAYAGGWAAFNDIMWGAIFMLGAICFGLGAFRAGRGLLE